MQELFHRLGLLREFAGLAAASLPAFWLHRLDGFLCFPAASACFAVGSKFGPWVVQRSSGY